MNDDMLWTAFTQRMLSHGEWKHRTHLRMAWLFVRRWPLLEAFMRLRVGIIRLNTAHGVDETAVRGYHDTLTYFWVVVIAALHAQDTLAGRASPNSEAFCAAHPELADRDHPYVYYSYEQLFSVQARATVQPPDLLPLPVPAPLPG